MGGSPVACDWTDQPGQAVRDPFDEGLASERISRPEQRRAGLLIKGWKLERFHGLPIMLNRPAAQH
jgi:hypothetical protein